MGPRNYHNAQTPRSKFGTGGLESLLRTSTRLGSWGKKSCPNHPVVPANPSCSLPANCYGSHGRTVVTVTTKRSTGSKSPVPALSKVNRHLLVNPVRCQLQMAPTTQFYTIIWLIFPKGNRPMSRPQQSAPGPNRHSKVPS